MVSNFIITIARKIFHFFSSLKTAIPLLVITILVTICGSLMPTPDFFRTWWYLGLLGLNGVSLLFVTILHIPMIMERKGRNALIGVVVTHAGIMVLIAGIIYGGISGFRLDVKAIEGEMTVVPGLPFVIQLDQLVVEEYAPGEVANLDPEFVPRKRQESRLSFYKAGQLVTKATAAPGFPAKFDGYIVLPAFNDIGWYFELIVKDWRGNDKVVPVRSGSPSIIMVRNSQIMVHSQGNADEPGAQIFTQISGQPVSLGVVKQDQAVELDGLPIRMGDSRRYTGLVIYNRPHAPVLVAGCMAMLFGLVWHFYFRHRDRKTKE